MSDGGIRIRTGDMDPPWSNRPVPPPPLSLPGVRAKSLGIPLHEEVEGGDSSAWSQIPVHIASPRQRIEDHGQTGLGTNM